MIKHFLSLVVISSSLFGASNALENLIKYDKHNCLEKLENASDAELWNVFLKGQADLFFSSEALWLGQNTYWNIAKRILEIGSGNGAYLHRLAQHFPDKMFHGIELLPASIEKANDFYATDTLTFQEGDAEICDISLEGTANIVLFRLTLQHLNDPVKALLNAATYLEPDGHVVIIESFDKAHKNSPPLPAVDEALRLALKAQTKGNRKVSFELFQAMYSDASELSKVYEIEFSNLDLEGQLTHSTTIFEGDINRIRYYNHALLFLTLLQRTYGISIDLSKLYDDLQVYVRDENAWSMPGTHFLVLKKKSSKT
ncbi:MAG: hypothetical protein SP1CHLAM54_14890 [Chlamydiia bacterium]|nr:hypothetical protein [Chlamydiia bacterium]MCH9616379.1 hypothetical protein [Chlamydiia bacterium]MCH9629635.1 hypothetical protein [Chlamydiia bacterium]